MMMGLAIWIGWFVGQCQSEVPVLQGGFYLPNQAPLGVISECRPPYCIIIRKDNGRWFWLVYKHGDSPGMLRGGITETYSLSRNISLVCVADDKKR
jgi:hypothetical protein